MPPSGVRIEAPLTGRSEAFNALVVANPTFWAGLP
jgi:hypothetical protein